jgi:hypothetical protein
MKTGVKERRHTESSVVEAWKIIDHPCGESRPFPASPVKLRLTRLVTVFKPVETSLDWDGLAPVIMGLRARSDYSVRREPVTRRLWCSFVHQFVNYLTWSWISGLDC